jgi:hypothetical protein
MLNSINSIKTKINNGIFLSNRISLQTKTLKFFQSQNHKNFNNNNRNFNSILSNKDKINTTSINTYKYSYSYSFTNKNTNINLNYRNNFYLKNLSFKNFCDKNKKDPQTNTKTGERRRIGLKTTSQEDLLKKKMELLKQKEEEEKKIKNSQTQTEENLDMDKPKDLFKDKDKKQYNKKEKYTSSSDDEEYTAVKLNEQYSNVENKNTNIDKNKITNNLDKENVSINNININNKNKNFNEEKEKDKLIIDEKDQISFNHIFDRDLNNRNNNNNNKKILSDPNISDEDKKLFAKILGDLKRIDALDAFQSEKINDLIMTINLDKNSEVSLKNKYNEKDFLLKHDISKYNKNKINIK